MRSTFGPKRQARKVGLDEDVDDDENARPGLGIREQGMCRTHRLWIQISNVGCWTNRLTACLESTPTVVRPQSTSRGSSKAKKRSSLRVSFGPGGTSMAEDDDASAVFIAKKSSLNRQATENNALRKSLASSLSSEHVPFRQTEERPSYNADYLNELKTSTPSTPKDIRPTSDEETKALDLAAKFGTDLVVQDSSSAIPTDAEIREKKERRARLAKEQDYITLSDADEAEREGEDENSNDEISLLPYAQNQKSKHPETRLVRDDEDIAEGFDEFVSDGQMALGKKAAKEQKRKHDAEIRNLINEAEGGNGSDDSEEDESEVERNAAYEAAQTRKGMDGLDRGEHGVKPQRPRTPPRITPLPSLGGSLETLKGRLEAVQLGLVVKRRRMEEVEKEKADIGIREEEIQRLLKETAESYEKLRVEAGLDGGEKQSLGGGQVVGTGGEGMGEGRMGLGMSDRGLDDA